MFFYAALCSAKVQMDCVSRNRVAGETARGFESHRLRHFCKKRLVGFGRPGAFPFFHTTAVPSSQIDASARDTRTENQNALRSPIMKRQHAEDFCLQAQRVEKVFSPRCADFETYKKVSKSC